MIFATLWTFITLHWHQVATVAAFGFAMYNKIMHDRLLTVLAQKAATSLNAAPAPPPPMNTAAIPQVQSKHKSKKRKKHKH